jgi:hypothetical protein
MNVYDIETDFTFGQKHSVVANNMAEAERIFKGKYWPTTINKIVLHSEYVQIQTFDEQIKESSDAKT